MDENRIQVDSSLDFCNVAVGVITALEEEYAACKEIFDPDKDGHEISRRATSGHLTCWLCEVKAREGGKHIVAISMLPDMGNNSAAIGANILLQHCENIQYLIMCGIAGAVPDPENPDNHVRLGDIVISDGQGVIQYDRGKQRDPLLFIKSPENSLGETQSTLNPFDGFDFRGAAAIPCQNMLAAVRRMHANELLLNEKDFRDWEIKINHFLENSGNPNKWKRPTSSNDILKDSIAPHAEKIKHPVDKTRRTVDRIHYPKIYRGPIGAANIVLADPNRRNLLRDRFKIKAVEMEASGIADVSWISGIGYLIVRGTCDYCNTQKNDIWHKYAALIAAAYTHTVIEYLPDFDSPQSPVPPKLSDKTFQFFPPHSKTANQHSLNIEDISPEKHRNEKDNHTQSTDLSFRFGKSDIDTSSQQIPEEMSGSLSSRKNKDQRIFSRINELIDKVSYLRKDKTLEEAKEVATELETYLSNLPRKGKEIRTAWLLLADLEVASLMRDKHNNKKIDTSKLQRLRQEAESVVE